MHDIIVIGASAGGLPALIQLISLLPSTFSASLFVTLHLPPESTSNLATILRRAGVLEAVFPRYHEPIQPGYIYVAPPNWHLILDAQGVHLNNGPRENGARPAVDPLFRSAADAFGERVVGIILSGALDDGVGGLAAIKARGGLAIAQDPKEADFEGMPRSAIENVDVDHILPVAQIAPLLVQLAARRDAQTDDLPGQAAPAMGQAPQPPSNASSTPQWELQFRCPDCNGVLLPVKEGSVAQFRCEVGHFYSPHTLLSEQSRDLENALWGAVRVMHERARFLRQLAANTRERGNPRSALHYEAQAHEIEEQAQTLRELMSRFHSGGDNLE
jgi:two-component system, chemotaxis family, protein-glutamate methylesterase/glutaminase